MPERPFFKFYPSDWRADKELRLCGAAARGLWIEMLCVMHEAKPRGHLLVNGRPVTDMQLVSLTGFPLDQIAQLLTELDNAGVFSRTTKGVIYSRRMTRDERKASKCSKAGKDGGGNPTLGATFKGHDKGGGANTFVLEARDQNLENKKKDSQEILSDLSAKLRGRSGTWTAEQKKAAWQGKVSVEAQRTLPEADYQKFMVAWFNEEPWAIRKAEEISRLLSKRTKTVAA